MATYKHLRSSTANKRPTTGIADGQLAINTNTASPGLFFKDSAGTGIVKVGPVHVGTTAPNSVPASGGSTGNYKGEQWLDTSVSPAQMKVWNGSAWIGVVADELPVSKLQDGDAGQIVQTDSAGTGVEWSSTTNLPLGSAGAPAYRFQGDANTGIYSPGADQVAVGTFGTERLRITSDGKLGLGTSSPSSTFEVTSSSIESLLGVKATATKNGYLDLDADANRRAVIRFNSAGVAQWSIGRGDSDELSADAFHISTGTSGGGNAKFVITSAGNVGVGTTSPTEALEVAGNAILDASDATLKIKAGGAGTVGAVNFTFNTDSNVYGGIDLAYDNRVTDGVRLYSGGNGYPVTLQAENSSVRFATRISGVQYERARIDSSGRLLVGTSSSLSGGAFVNAASTQDQFGFQRAATDWQRASAGFFTYQNALNISSQISLNKSRSTSVGGFNAVAINDDLGTIVFSGADGSKFVPAACIFSEVDGTPGTNDMPGRLVFSTTADGASSPTERMRIKANGSILFADDDEAGITAGTVNGKSIEAGSIMRSSRATTSSASHVAFYNTNGLVGQISTSASATSYTTSSDYRLKENVTPVIDGITRLQQLKPSRFNFIADPTKTVDGFLAHEAAEVVPECVTGEKDAVDDDGNPVYQGIDQSKLVPLLTAALQEAIAKIESLEARLTAAGL